MKFYSTNHQVATVTFKEAVFKGLPDDNGLYMPEHIPQLQQSFFDNLKDYSFAQLAYEIVNQFVKEEIPEPELKKIVNEAFNFKIPVKNLHDNIYVLELFHGPTLAFKDFGARFMARVMGYFLQREARDIHILVATSGDTGSAVAQGFLGVEGVHVTLLYPKGKVSKIQEQQLCTVGGNVTALEVEGTFDDCQKMVKEAFLDPELNRRLNLSSANSINIARLLPQSLYYFYSYGQVVDVGEEVCFSVPSGNFGNLSGGLLARRMGLPVVKFIAATNVNDIVPEYLKFGTFNPRPSIRTISNAMDVGNPSNFARMLDLFDNDHDAMIHEIVGVHYTDEDIRRTMREVFDQYGYHLCPHSAIGYAGLRDKLPGSGSATGIFLSSAHPSKFEDVVKPVTGVKPEMPLRLKRIIENEKQSIEMPVGYEHLKSFLMES